MRALSIFLFLVFGFSALAEDVPCWMNPDTIPETEQVAILKTYLLPINLEAPEEDLKARIKHHDNRFIAIGGFRVTYPGLTDKELLCKYGFRYIIGTSDALESREHRDLIQAFSRYAAKYNKALEGILGGK